MTIPKRIYLVADYRGQRAGKVLFKPESVSRYPPKGGCPWKRTAEGTQDGIGKAGTVCLNDQGGNRTDVTEDITSTLRAESHHPPCVADAAGFCTEHSANSRSIGYEQEVSPSLRAGTVPATVYENHGQDTRFKGPLDTAPTVNATYGAGGNNQPFVVENTKCYDVRFTSEGTKNARQNCYETDKARTIDTGGNAPDSNQGGVAVVYGICSKGSNSMKSDNPHSGFYEADTSRCLDANGGNPSCNQGGMVVVCVDQGGSKSNCCISKDIAPTLACTHGGEPAVCVQGSMIGRKDENGPQGSGINEGVSFTLNATDKHAVAYGIDRAAFNQGQNAKYSFAVEQEVQPTMVAKGPGAVAAPTYSSSKASFFTNAEKELANTLVATDYKDPPIINDTDDNAQYIVRRLTPTECARLQGFPADWHNIVNAKGKEMPDTATYRGYGNAVATVCAEYPIQGIYEILSKEKQK